MMDGIPCLFWCGVVPCFLLGVFWVWCWFCGVGCFGRLCCVFVVSLVFTGRYPSILLCSHISCEILTGH